MKKAKCFKCDKILKLKPGFGGHGDFVLDKRDKDGLDIFICGCPRTLKFKIDLKTMIYIGSLLVSGITMYFTFMSELDARFGALEDGDNTMMVDMDKRLTALETNIDKRVTELENKFTPIGDGVYAVDPNSSWPPSRGEYKMKDEMSRNKIMALEKEIEELKEEIEDLEDKVK